MAVKKRFRIRFPFWLDMNKPEEEALADEIELLKNDKQFAPTIRDGLRLIISLRRKQLDVLFELFPWIADDLFRQGRGGNGSGDLEKQIADLKAIILQGNIAAPPPDYPAMKPTGASRPLTSQKFAAPVFDDDQDTIILKRTTDTSASGNLLAAMMNLQQ